jgi:hypothetical protein
MCTIGAVRFPDGVYTLFKNKDFNRSHFDDRTTIEPDVFGVAGLATWAASGDDDVFSGFSISANAAGVLCANANVGSVRSGASYDDLVEIAVREGSDVPGAIDAVAAAVAERPYHRANLVLIDATETAVVEIHGGHIYVLRSDGSVVRTNHHTSIGPGPGDDNTTTTVPRLRVAMAALPSIESRDDVLALQQRHEPDGGSICVHGVPGTVYSYVIERRPTGTVLSVKQGRPCDPTATLISSIPLGASWSPEAAATFAAAYPSAAI